MEHSRFVKDSNTKPTITVGNLLYGMVGPGRFELPAPSLSEKCSKPLSYGPKNNHLSIRLVSKKWKENFLSRFKAHETNFVRSAK